MLKKIFTVALLVLSFFSLSFTTHAVYFASDSVYLYENGQRISENSVIWRASSGYTQLCENGVCEIGQQFYPVKIYKTTEQNLTQREITVNRLVPMTTLEIEFNPGPSLGGEGCGTPNCIGGRMGTERAFDLELTTGKHREHGSIFGINLYSPMIIYTSIAVGIIAFVIGFTVLLKKRKGLP